MAFGKYSGGKGYCAFAANFCLVSHRSLIRISNHAQRNVHNCFRLRYGRVTHHRPPFCPLRNLKKGKWNEMVTQLATPDWQNHPYRARMQMRRTSRARITHAARQEQCLIGNTTLIYGASITVLHICYCRAWRTSSSCNCNTERNDNIPKSSEILKDHVKRVVVFHPRKPSGSHSLLHFRMPISLQIGAQTRPANYVMNSEATIFDNVP